MVIGTAVLYACGTAWLAYQSSVPFGAALMLGVVPFLPGDALKIVVIAFAAPSARRALRRALGR
jgi:biotin transport system substrate-specific component